MRTTFKSCLIGLATLISGATLTLAFAPFQLFPLAILAPAIMLWFWLSSTPRKAFLYGWLFGVGLFSTGVYWIFISIHTYGNTSTLLALGITALLIAFLALYPGFTGYLLSKFFPENNTIKMVCAFPALWVFAEWVRSWAFSGFPWLILGYSQIHSPLKGYAPLFSVFGVSLAMLICSGLLVNIILEFRKSQSKNVIYSLLAFIAIWLTGFVLSLASWTTSNGKLTSVSLVQGNIPQQVKWSPEQVQPTLDQYLKLSEQHWDKRIVVWPESAIPLPLQSAEEFLNELAYKAKKSQSTLITGIPVQTLDHKSYYNAVIAMGDGRGVYMKHRLVPFGEYIPMKKSLGRLLDLLQVPMSDFTPGLSPPLPIVANGLKIATFICYEIAYPEQVLSRDSDIDLILTVSNDAWFGRSIAQAQHLEMAQMRALEMGRPLLFASNDGITAIINARGKIQAYAPPHESYVLSGEVNTMHGKTPWQKLGMDTILGLLTALLLVALIHRKTHD